MYYACSKCVIARQRAMRVFESMCECVCVCE